MADQQTSTDSPTQPHHRTNLSIGLLMGGLLLILGTGVAAASWGISSYNSHLEDIESTLNVQVVSQDSGSLTIRDSAGDAFTCAYPSPSEFNGKLHGCILTQDIG